MSYILWFSLEHTRVSSNHVLYSSCLEPLVTIGVSGAVEMTYLYLFMLTLKLRNVIHPLKISNASSKLHIFQYIFIRYGEHITPQFHICSFRRIDGLLSLMNGKTIYKLSFKEF